jgi:folate-binding protein YgfZ
MTPSASVSQPAGSAALARAVACPADDIALLRIEGADAESFLQGQLSGDVKALRDGDVQWTSYNSPKGRMLASLALWREREGVYGAALAADLAAAIAKRLRMYVLRAKVTITGRGDAALGVAGPAAGVAVGDALHLDVRAGRIARTDGAEAIGLPDGRVLVTGPACAAVRAALAPGDEATWRYARIAAGVPLVSAATTDQFVPQSLNFDALGGISFRKGCYPGQEIVARTHYLGRLKERLYAYRADTAAAPAAGERVFAAVVGDQPCGTVVNVAPHPEGGYALLAVVQRDAAQAEGEAVHLAAPAGVPLMPAPLPYAVPEPVPPRGRMA